MRLFFALWPDDVARKQFEAVGAVLPKERGRRVSPANLHLTLAFLGNVSEDDVDELKAGMDAVQGEALTLVFDRAGWFRRAQVIWLAPSEVPDPLPRLVRGINGMARSRGLQVDDKPFRPHLTLARKATRFTKPEFDPIRWDIRDFCLVQSITHATGPEYRILQRRALTSA
ncbi:MAG: RNA 2',3'-cyclic phosphodiesterase [Gammaproteobacteria bacterium]